MDYIELKVSINPLEIGRDVLIAQLAEIGYESFVEQERGVNAYIQKQHFNTDLVEALGILSDKDYQIKYAVNVIEDQNWNEVWEQNFDPIVVGDQCVVRAPFHEQSKDIEYDILIEPKMSFGTGHHETTHLMIERLLSLNLNGLDVLDMGCGTGVLAVLSKMKGANNVVGIDIDDWAYNNALENIKRNNVDNIDVKLGGAELLVDLKFDIIIANINRNILLQDMERYVKSLKAKGVVLLSGFFSSDKEILLEEAKKNGLSLSFCSERNDWTMMELNVENDV